MSEYEHHFDLNAHTEPVLSLAISPGGDYLASGGMLKSLPRLCRLDNSCIQGRDKMRLWDLKVGQELQTVESGTSIRGIPSALAWLKHRSDQRDVLIFGTGRGYLVTWRQSQATVREYYIPRAKS